MFIGSTKHLRRGVLERLRTSQASAACSHASIGDRLGVAEAPRLKGVKLNTFSFQLFGLFLKALRLLG